MADKDLKLNLIAKDGVSGPLKKISDAADDTTQALDKIGTEGDQSLDQVEKSAKSAEKAVDSVGNSAKRASLGFNDLEVAATAIGAGLTYAGNAALDHEQVLIGLRASFGDAADEMIRFADEMAATSIFNDDDILKGERYFATLKNNYDLSIGQIQDLMQVTADLASASGTSFEDASSRVTAAIRGEGEAAEFLGLTMNQQAIDRENLTLSMSNQEAAQFRLNALYEQSSAYAGTAQTLANSEVGTRARLTNALQDNAQALGDFIGPMGTMVGGMGLAVSGIGSMTGTLGRMANTARNSQRAMAALSMTFNPMTLGMGAIVGAGALIVNSFLEQREAAESLEASYASLSAQQNVLLLSGREEAAAQVAYMQAITQEFESNLAARREAVLTQVYPDWYENSPDPTKTPQEWLATMRDAYTFSAEETERFTASQSRLSEALSDTRVDGEALNAELDKLYNRYLTDATYTGDMFLGDLEALSKRTADFRTELTDTGESATGLAAALRLVRPEIEGLVQEFLAFNEIGEDDSFGERFLKTLGLDLATISEAEVRLGRLRGAWTDIDEDMPAPDASQEEWIAWVNQAERGTIEWRRRAEAANEARRAEEDLANQVEKGTGLNERYAESLDRIAGNAERVAQSASNAGSALAGIGTGALDDLAQVNQDFVESMQELAGIDYADQINLSGLGTEATRVVSDINDVATALDSVLTIYGSIDAMGQRMEQSGGIVNALFGPDGDPYDGVGALSDVYNAGLIGQQQFDQAVKDGIAIQEDAAAAQLYLNKMRVDQLPILEDTTQAYLDQVKAISELGAQDQMVALGWMDQGMQGRVQQFTEMVSQMNNLGPAGAAAIDQIIDGVAATDPVFTAMLEDLGLIERQLDGSYELNLDAAGALSDVERLTASIDALTLALGGTPPSYDIEVSGTEDVENAKQGLEDLAALSAQQHIVRIATELQDDGRERMRSLLNALGGSGGDGTGGPSVTLPIQGDTSGVSASLDQVRRDASMPVSVPVELDFGSVGSGASGLAQNAAQEAMGQIQNTVEITVTANADTSAADAAISDLTAYDGTTIATPVVMIDGDASDATGTVTAMGGYDGMTLATAIVAVVGDSTNAAAVVNGIRMTDGSILATNYIDIVTRTRTEELALGGVVREYADGGVVIRAAERGAEIARFANGGTAVLPHDGYYGVPVGTYISPNNAVGTAPGAPQPIVIQNYGTIIGVDELTEIIGGAVIEAQAEEAARYNRAHGRVFG